MSPEITVLIPSLISRRESLRDLLGDCERERLTAIVLVDAGGISIGRKMDMLADRATGDWMAGAGDDDRLLPGYGDAMREACAAAPEWVEGVYFPVDYWVSGERRGRCLKRPGTVFETGETGDLIRPPADRTMLRAPLRRRLRHKNIYWGEDFHFAHLLWQEGVAMIPVRDQSQTYYLASHSADASENTQFKRERDALGEDERETVCLGRTGTVTYLNMDREAPFFAEMAESVDRSRPQRAYMLVDHPVQPRAARYTR